MNTLTDEQQNQTMAIIGMAGRFPGARNIEQLWDNLTQGLCAATQLDLKNDDRVSLAYPLDDIDLFDANYFKMSPREAELMDPQLRLLLETAVHAFENAGVVPDASSGAVGTFIGSGVSTYMYKNLLPANEGNFGMDSMQLIVGNESPATQLSYRLNLTGPSMSVNTTCSSGLVAVQLACQSLLSFESDIALCGGVWINVSQREGYHYRPGSILSHDGYCRPFDKEANGTVGGNGLGLVVLKRLEDAIEDRDHIYALIRGIAVNNDGSDKVGYTAPSVHGQTEVIKNALCLSDIDIESIGYIEAHGTGTPLGDPIEIRALKNVFSNASSYKCSIGSIKSNIGHLNTASGIAGLIKTALCLYHKKIPKTLHYNEPNPELALETTSLTISDCLKDWHSNLGVRRAGVSSFGIGGTNAHAVLEEVVTGKVDEVTATPVIIALSAKTTVSLMQLVDAYIDYFSKNPNTNMQQVAYTLQMGRKIHAYRIAIVADTPEVAIQQLLIAKIKSLTEVRVNKICLLFPGQGAQSPKMCYSIYTQHKEFRQTVDSCSQYILHKHKLDIRPYLCSAEDDIEVRPVVSQISLFVVEYSLAKLWQSWGLKPAMMLGHSIGEYVAATVANVFQLEDTLDVLVKRARLVAGLSPGLMLAVSSSMEQLQPHLEDGCTFAAKNSQTESVISGLPEAIYSLEAKLKENKILCKRLSLSSAYHSPMLAAIAIEFKKIFNRIELRKPTIPYVSNLTGTWIQDEQATSPQYWLDQMCNTVLYEEGMQVLKRDVDTTFLEVGPGQVLTNLNRKSQGECQHNFINSLSAKKAQRDDSLSLMDAVARMWTSVGIMDWKKFNSDNQQHRIPLPAYTFERESYWVGRPDTALPEVSLRERAPKIVGEAKALDVVEKTELDKILSIWGSILGIADISPEDNFFALGGQSLLAAEMIAKIDETFSVEITFRELFDSPSPYEMESLVLGKLLELHDGDELLKLLSEIEVD